MRAVGEVMSIGKTIRKPSRRRSAAWRPALWPGDTPEIMTADPKRSCCGCWQILPATAISSCMKRFAKGATIDEIHNLTKVKPYFIEQMKELVEEEEALMQTKGSCLPTRR